MTKASIWRGRVVAVGFGLLFAPLLVKGQTPALEAGLAQLYDLAESHNLTLGRLRSALQEAESGITVARADRLPDISGGVAVSYLGNARLWNRHFGESTGAPMPHYGNNFLLRAQQVVYSGGAISGNIRLAEQQSEMAALSVEEGRHRVHFLLTGMYLQLHSLHNREAVYATNAALAEQQIELMKRRRDQGVSLRNDVTRYELQLQQMRLAESTMQDQQLIVRHQLTLAVGSDCTELPLLPRDAFDENAVARTAEADWQSIATTAHVGLRKSALAVDMSHTRERLERAALRPKVALFAEDHLDGPITIEVPPINKNLNYWYVGIGISYDFSALYKSNRRVRRARLGTEVARSDLAEAREQVDNAVHEAYINLLTAQRELTTRQKSVQLATENYDVVSRRYENGMALVTDLTDAANMKLDAELALENARINLVYCLYHLKYQAGTE